MFFVFVLSDSLVKMLALLLLVLGPLSVLGHGAMVWPYNWQDKNGEVGLEPYGYLTLGSVSWFTNWTFIPGEATLDPDLLTAPDCQEGRWDTKHCLDTFGTGYDICPAWCPMDPGRNPWMAPGSAPVDSPCGVLGGNPRGCPEGAWPPPKECPGGGSPYGPDALVINFPDVMTTEWRAGESATVGWGFVANHGGG